MDYQSLLKALGRDKILFITRNYGAGFSYAVRKAAAELDRPFVEFRASQMTPWDVEHRFSFIKEETVFFLDELDRALPEVCALLMKELNCLPKNVSVVFASVPVSCSCEELCVECSCNPNQWEAELRQL
jgi:hypothetical protein